MQTIQMSTSQSGCQNSIATVMSNVASSSPAVTWLEGAKVYIFLQEHLLPDNIAAQDSHKISSGT